MGEDKRLLKRRVEVWIDGKEQYKYLSDVGESCVISQDDQGEITIEYRTKLDPLPHPDLKKYGGA